MPPNSVATSATAKNRVAVRHYLLAFGHCDRQCSLCGRLFGYGSHQHVPPRVDMKWRFQFFAKYDYRFLLDVIIAIIATFFDKSDNRYFAIIAEYFA